MAFRDATQENLAMKRRALQGVKEVKEKAQSHYKELFKDTDPSDKFEDVTLKRFDGLPKEWKLAIEACRINMNLPFEIALPALLGTANFATAPHIDVDMWMFDDGFVMPTHIWILILAEASKGKTTIFNFVARNNIKIWEREKEIQFEKDLADYEIKKTIHKAQVGKVTRNTKLSPSEMQEEIEDLNEILGKPPVGGDWTVPTATLNGLINSLNDVPFCRIANDEAGQFFEGHSLKKDTEKEMITALSALWSGSEIGRITGIRDDKTKIRDRRFQMFFFTQPENAEFLSKRIYRKQGFLNRLLITQAPAWRLPKMAGKTKGASTKAGEMMKGFDKRVLEMLREDKQFYSDSEVRLAPKLYEFTDEAADFIKEYNDILDNQSQPGEMYEEFAGFAGRGVEHATRFASIFTKWLKKDKIDLDDILLGVEIFEWFLEALLNLEIGGTSKFADQIATGERLVKWMKGRFDKDTKHGKKGQLICPAEGRAQAWITTKAPRFWSHNLVENERKEILTELVKRKQLSHRVDGKTDIFALIR